MVKKSLKKRFIYSKQNKNKLLKSFHQLNAPIRRFAKLNGLPESTLCTWLTIEEKEARITNMKSTGRKPLLNSADHKRLATFVRLHPFWSAWKICIKMHQLGSPLFKKRTLHNYIKKLGYKFKKPSKLIKFTSILCQQRFQWCIDNERLPLDNILFVDESTVWARSIPSKGWFKTDSSWLLYCKDYGKFNMLGRISTKVKSQLKVFEGNMNSIKFIEIMEEILPKQCYPIKGRRQMQILLDNSRIHTSKKVKE